MRAFAVIPLLIAAACGSETEQKAEKAEALQPGEWEVTAEVTGFRTVDPGTPLLQAEVGARSSEKVCVGAEGRLPPALFAGEQADCGYGTYYVRGGRMSVQLNCPPARGEGLVSITAEGTFEADSLEARRELATAVTGGGNVRIDSRLTGRRTGDCTPEPDEGAGNAAG